MTRALHSYAVLPDCRFGWSLCLKLKAASRLNRRCGRRERHISHLAGRRDYYDRDDRSDNNICLRCFLTVQGSRWESPEEAKLEHKKLCPFRRFDSHLYRGSVRAALEAVAHAGALLVITPVNANEVPMAALEGSPLEFEEIVSLEHARHWS